MWFFILLGTAVYLLIGGAVAAIVNDEEMTAGCVFLWPFMAVMFTLVGIYLGVVKIGEIVVGGLSRYWERITKGE